MTQSDAEAGWHAIWARRGWRACLLWPLSLLYGALLRFRRWRFARGAWPIERLPVPVIVVGNVVVGGAGKTPTVLALVAHLRSRGWHPGVVSRGHGREGAGVLALSPDTPASEAGDEPTLIHRQTGVPVFVGRQRAQAARALLAAHPQVDVLLCDDGLQHLALGRDVAIAVFDDRGLGNRWLLPAGLLREPWPPSHGDPFGPQLVLRQRRAASPPGPELPLPVGATAFVAERHLAGFARTPDGEQCPLTALQGRSLVAVAGIARPQVFFDMLRDQGLTLSRCIALPDHAATPAYQAALAAPGEAVVCTEKDAVKLFALARTLPASQRPALWTVPLELQIDPAFFAALDRHLAVAAADARLSSRHGQQTA
jgi:tetraacyldisaccharide 4'-kinase